MMMEGIERTGKEGDGEGGDGEGGRWRAVTWRTLIGGGGRHAVYDNTLLLSHWLLGPASSATVTCVDSEEVWAQIS